MGKVLCGLRQSVGPTDAVPMPPLVLTLLFFYWCTLMSLEGVLHGVNPSLLTYVTESIFLSIMVTVEGLNEFKCGKHAMENLAHHTHIHTHTHTDIHTDTHCMKGFHSYSLSTSRMPGAAWGRITLGFDLLSPILLVWFFESCFYIAFKKKKKKIN